MDMDLTEQSAATQDPYSLNNNNYFYESEEAECNYDSYNLFGEGKEIQKYQNMELKDINLNLTNLYSKDFNDLILELNNKIFKLFKYNHNGPHNPMEFLF